MANTMRWTETLTYSSEHLADLWEAKAIKVGDPEPWYYYYLIEPNSMTDEKLEGLRELANASFIRRGVYGEI